MALQVLATPKTIMNLDSAELSRRALLQLSASTCAATLAQRIAPAWAQGDVASGFGRERRGHGAL